MVSRIQRDTLAVWRAITILRQYVGYIIAPTLEGRHYTVTLAVVCLRHYE